ncbi:MAG: type II toxin-antitoxin system RelE/ParE family toxin [Pseudomonadota bacterium]
MLSSTAVSRSRSAVSSYFDTEGVRTYVASLKAGIARVAAGQGVFKELDALYPALRMARCVFCLPRQNAPALIVAILHERMDLMARLADRLND